MPLNRKVSMRDAYAAKLRTEGRYTSFRRKQTGSSSRVLPCRGKPLKKISRSQRERLKRYFAIRNEWLSLPENAVCAICLVRGMNPAPATECHHSRGRAGKLLFDTRFWRSSCRNCREWPHENPREARELGILASPVEWNVSVPEENI